ncbi:MAG: Do family serine endopeptidase [Deltaproteobacteria bacterium]|nr:Do family serine endopeptidase [Deltaproteobacteria bacterium]
MPRWPRDAAFVLALLVVPAGCRERAARGPEAQSTKVAASHDAAAFRAPPPGPAIFARPAFAQVRTGPTEVSLSDVAERAVKSVVNISTTRDADAALPRADDSPFGLPPGRRAQSLGSGVIVSADGLVLTNHHVVAKSSEIRVTLADGRELRAALVGSDPKSDVAVLRLQQPFANVTPIALGDSSRLRLAEVVLAIGNPFGVGQTVTLGIVSATGRADMGIVDYEDFIQTDAAINPGNSGGALVNLRGELVGINTAILSRSGGSQGIGFAIPTGMVRPIMESLLKHGRVIRGWVGIAIQPLTPELAKALRLTVERGVVVADVQAGSPAAKAGLRRGDVVTAIDGQPTSSVAKLRNRIATGQPGRRVSLSVARGAEVFTVAVELATLPSDRIARLDKTQGALGGLTLQTVTDEVRQKLGLPPNVEGVLVTAVEPRSASAAAGFQVGDVILELNRRSVANALQFSLLYRQTRGKVLLLVYRDGSTLYLMLEK